MTEKVQKQKRKDDPKTSRWARDWRETFRTILPPSSSPGVPITDTEVRHASAALWYDVVDWAAKAECAPYLALFAAETPGVTGPGRGSWAFVPANDLLLVVGEGSVGFTSEGIVADNPLLYKRQPFSTTFYGTPHDSEAEGGGLQQQQQQQQQQRHG